MTASSRRDFFRQLARRALGQVTDGFEGGSLDRRELDGRGLERNVEGLVSGGRRSRLRPPGAAPEDRLLETCSRSGRCVEACPARAIYLVPDPGDPAYGTPVIDADLQPCLVCDRLACMRVCPSGALQPLPGRDQIRMGRARVDAGQCLRSEGQDCRECVDHCPLGPGAIHLDAAGAVEVLDGCIGCGVCQWKCPARPKAVVVDGGLVPAAHPSASAVAHRGGDAPRAEPAAWRPAHLTRRQE